MTSLRPRKEQLRTPKLTNKSLEKTANKHEVSTRIQQKDNQETTIPKTRSQQSSRDGGMCGEILIEASFYCDPPWTYLYNFIKFECLGDAMSLCDDIYT